MKITKPTYTKHHYLVVCECGSEKINNDDNVLTECELLKVAYCKKCCTTDTVPAQVPYTKEGERIYL